MSRRWAILPRRASSLSGDRPSSSRLADYVDGAPLGCLLAVSAVEDDDDGDRWSKLLPELLTDIIKRVERSEDRWPLRRSVVACACVCKKWREITTAVVQSTTPSGVITFPFSLKQRGPRDAPMQCFVKRDMKDSTFSLHLGVADTFKARGKFLMAAQRCRSGAHTEYILTIASNDSPQRSNANAYMGKLRSDFLGTKFTFYDSQQPYNGANSSSSRPAGRFTTKKISPHVPAGNFKFGSINYQFNLLKSRGPRRMCCLLQLPSSPDEVALDSKHGTPESPLLLKNKTPRWHEHLQCWCLNFHGRVTVASVKNFQLVSVEDEETVLLQFGKIGDDLFNMDYRYPLSAFHAFIICLTSFGTKIACE